MNGARKRIELFIDNHVPDPTEAGRLRALGDAEAVYTFRNNGELLAALRTGTRWEDFEQFKQVRRMTRDFADEKRGLGLEHELPRILHSGLNHRQIAEEAEQLLSEADPSLGRGGGGGRGRFYGEDTWTWTGLGHGISNAIYGQGAWSYREYVNPLKWIGFRQRERDKTSGRQVPAPRYANTPRPRGQGQVMGEHLQGHGTVSAHAHAASTMVLPPAPQSGDDYEWCHLWGWGLGGSQTADNLVSASHACNSEMLAIEQWVYASCFEGRRPKRLDQRVSIRVSARLARGTEHVAELITYEIFMPNQNRPFFSRWIDGRRAVEPSIAERDRIQREIQEKYDQAA